MATNSDTYLKIHESDHRLPSEIFAQIQPLMNEFREAISTYPIEEQQFLRSRVNGFLTSVQYTRLLGIESDMRKEKDAGK